MGDGGNKLVCLLSRTTPAQHGEGVGQDYFLNSFVLAAGSFGHWGAAQRQLCQLLSPMGAGLHLPSPGMQDLAPR